MQPLVTVRSTDSRLTCTEMHVVVPDWNEQVASGEETATPAPAVTMSGAAVRKELISWAGAAGTPISRLPLTATTAPEYRQTRYSHGAPRTDDWPRL